MKVFRFRATATCFAIVLCFTLGCGRTPQIPKSDYQLVSQLRTAVAAKKNDWLDEVAKKLDERNRSGSTAKEEQAALESIVALARQGNWDEANRKLLDLVNSQKPR
jgi:hypothetical protein